MTNPNLAVLNLQALFLVALVVIAVIVFLRYQARRRAWGELAMRTGLTCEPAGFLGLSQRVTGAYRGRALTLDTFTRRSGEHSTTYTRIVVPVNNASSLRLELYEQGLLSEIGKLLGAQDIQTGDQELDRRFIIKGQPEDAIVRLLTSGGLYDKLLQARSLNLRVDGGQVRWEKRNVESDVDYLQSLFDLLSDLAEAVERVGS
jgi:hypothetical protein